MLLVKVLVMVCCSLYMQMIRRILIKFLMQPKLIDFFLAKIGEKGLMAVIVNIVEVLLLMLMKILRLP